MSKQTEIEQKVNFTFNKLCMTVFLTLLAAFLSCVPVLITYLKEEELFRHGPLRMKKRQKG